MDSKQLYSGGVPFFPKSSAGEAAASDTHGLTGRQETTVQALLDEIADRIVNRLLERGDIAAWAKQEQKPAYTAGEVGADAEGSARHALAEAKEYSDAAYRQATGYTDQAVAGLVNGAQDTLNTLKKIADEMAENEDVVMALQNAIGSKASDVELQAHMSNGTVHVTSSEKRKWNDAVSKKADKSEIPDVGNGTVVIKQAGVQKGTFTMNQSGDTEIELADSNTTYSNFVKSGSGAKAGLVPSPGTTEGTSKFLREDGTWKKPPNTTYGVATQSANGLMSAADKKKLDEVAEGSRQLKEELDSAGLEVSTGTAGIVSYAKWGKIVTIYCSKNYIYDAVNRMKWISVATLPAGYRPKTETAGTLNAFGAAGWFRIGTNGVVAIISESTASATEPVRFSAAFIAA